MDTDIAEGFEKALITGDLSKLTTEQRISYYNEVCKSVGLNPLTKPFEYIMLNGKLTLYALKSATEQLRKINGISLEIVDKQTVGDIFMVTTKATDKSGRTDISVGAVNIAGLKGEALANAIMKAETKSKRRVTLSICGLGMLDETEVETIPNAKKFEESSDLKSIFLKEVESLGLPKQAVTSFVKFLGFTKIKEENEIKMSKLLQNKALLKEKVEEFLNPDEHIEINPNTGEVINENKS